MRQDGVPVPAATSPLYTRIGAVRIVPTLLFFTLDRPRKHPTSRRVFIKLHVWRSDRVCKTEYISHITVLSRYH